MPRPNSIEDSKLHPGGMPRRPLLRRLLGLTLVIAGLAMLMSGIGSAFFR